VSVIRITVSRAGRVGPRQGRQEAGAAGGYAAPAADDAAAAEESAAATAPGMYLKNNFLHFMKLKMSVYCTSLLTSHNN
jgi:hypothetical protein